MEKQLKRKKMLMIGGMILLVGLVIFQMPRPKYAASQYLEAEILNVEVNVRAVPKEKMIYCTLCNHSDRAILYGEEIALEYNKNGQWKEVLNKLGQRGIFSGYNAIGYELSPGGCGEESLDVGNMPYLRDGEYRVIIPASPEEGMMVREPFRWEK